MAIGWSSARLIFLVLKQRIVEEETFSQAAALTYKTLFSLLPIFVLALLILSAISTTGSKYALDAMVQKSLIKQLQLDKLPIVDGDGHQTKNDKGNPVMLGDVVVPMLNRAKEAVTTPATGLIAFAILLYGSVSLMIVIEGVFNQIYGAVKGRSWTRRLMLYWSVLTLGPIGVAASLVLGRNALDMTRDMPELVWVLVPLNVLTGFSVSWLLILLMYKVIPETRVKWKSAAMGSFLAALLWEAGKTGFGIYVRQAVVGSWYGSLVLLPLFMMWIYLTWNFVLLGLQVSYAHQYWDVLRRRFYFTQRTPVPITDLRWALSLGIVLYRQFRVGKTISANAAAVELLMPHDVTAQLLVGFEQAGLVHRVRDQSYALARPPESITAQDLLAAARGLSQAPPELLTDLPEGAIAVTPPLLELDRLETEWAKAHTLPMLAGETSTMSD